jgi:hypothetical protein
MGFRFCYKIRRLNKALKQLFTTLLKYFYQEYRSVVRERPHRPKPMQSLAFANKTNPVASESDEALPRHPSLSENRIKGCRRARRLKDPAHQAVTETAIVMVSRLIWTDGPVSSSGIDSFNNSIHHRGGSRSRLLMSFYSLLSRSSLTKMAR